MRWIPLALLLPGSCTYSLEGEIVSVRTEIVEMQRKIPPEAPLWVSEGPDRFDQFLDDSSDRVPDFIYHHLLRKLNGLRVEQVDAQAEGEFDPEACAKDPGSFRGRIWRVHGVVADLHVESVRDPQCPVRTVHAGLFFDGRGRPVLFRVVLKPDVLTLREDTVETRAVFVKMIDLTTRSGRRLSAPLFVGKVLRRYL